MLRVMGFAQICNSGSMHTRGSYHLCGESLGGLLGALARCLVSWDVASGPHPLVCMRSGFW